ncbi:MAG: hypothetical protein R2932_06300 [Caldilineaceae bacterium]
MAKQFLIVVRPVQQDDAISLQANCFTANTIEQVQEALAHTKTATADGQELQLVAVVNGQVIGSATLIRDPMRYARIGLVSLAGCSSRLSAAQRCAGGWLMRCLPMLKHLALKSWRPVVAPARALNRSTPNWALLNMGDCHEGIYQTWGEPTVFAEVYFYRECKRKGTTG